MRTCIKCLVVGIMCSAVSYGPLLCQMPEQQQEMLPPDGGGDYSAFQGGMPGGSAGMISNGAMPQNGDGSPMPSTAVQPSPMPAYSQPAPAPAPLAKDAPDMRNRGVQQQAVMPIRGQQPLPMVPQGVVGSTMVQEVQAPAPVVASPVQEQPEAPRPQEEGEVVSKDKPTHTGVASSEQSGIDTLEMDEPGGNWLVKRMWWEKAEEKIDKIEASLQIINDSRTAFYDKRDQLDSKLFDPFYSEVGLDQGQLEEIILFLLEGLQEKREKDVVLDKDALELRRKIEAEKKVLEDLSADVTAVRKLDDALDEALDKLVEQINLTRKYRKEAQQLFKDIAQVLDHEKAREYYYKMDAAWQNIKGIQEYISGKFTEYFNQLAKNAEDQVGRIKSVMNDLEKRGVSLKDQFKKRQTDEQLKKDEAARLLAEQRAKEEEAQGGIWKSIVRVISAPFKMVWGWLSSFGNWVSSWWKSAPDVQEEPLVEQAQTPVSQPATVQPADMPAQEPAQGTVSQEAVSQANEPERQEVVPAPVVPGEQQSKMAPDTNQSAVPVHG